MVTLTGCAAARRVCLRPRWGCGCWSRGPRCVRRMYFGFLPPGEYVLTLAGQGGCLELLVRLSPGSNAEILWRPEDGSWRWRQDPFHYCFNQA